MSVVNRGVRNAFRNQIRSFSIIVILGLSIGLALAMLPAHQAVGQKIESVKGSVGNTISISPAGFRGFGGGGGNPLTQDHINKVKNIKHVSSVSESLNDRLTSTDTNLQSSIEAGALGRRFGNGSFGGNTVTPDGSTPSFTPPVTVIGTNDPTNLNTAGGGTFKLSKGEVFSGNSIENVAIVGSSLASKNNLSVGSTFTAYDQTIKVVGVYDGGNTFSNSQLIIPLATVQKLSDQDGDITSATAKVDSIDNLDWVTSSIKTTLGSSADVTNDQTRTQDTIDSLMSIKKVSLYSLVGAVAAGAVIIFLTIGVVAGNPITHMLVSNNSSSAAQPVSTNGPRFVTGGPAGFSSNGPSSSVRGQRPDGNFPGFRTFRNNLSNINASVGWSVVLYGLLAAIVIAVIGSSVASWFIAKVRPAEVMRAE
jgi:putative ABC transport system permease protein